MIESTAYRQRERILGTVEEGCGLLVLLSLDFEKCLLHCGPGHQVCVVLEIIGAVNQGGDNCYHVY